MKIFLLRFCITNMLSDGKANQSITKTIGEEDYPNTLFQYNKF